YLVGTRKEELADVLDLPDPAAHGQRHEAVLGGARDDVENRLAILVRGGDVEEAEFVRARRIVDDRRLDRIARIDEIDELHALDHAAVFYIEAGNDAGLEAHAATSLR